MSEGCEAMSLLSPLPTKAKRVEVQYRKRVTSKLMLDRFRLSSIVWTHSQERGAGRGFDV